jgi:hypothetical protein
VSSEDKHLVSMPQNDLGFVRLLEIFDLFRGEPNVDAFCMRLSIGSTARIGS